MRNNFSEFKNPIITVIIIFVAFFLYTKIAGPIPFFVNSIQTTKTDLFSSTGEGKVSAVPDSATVIVGVTAQGATVSEAQNKANQIAAKIIDSSKSLGVPEKDIKTTSYSVNPNYGGGEVRPVLYPQTGGNQSISSYTVTQNLEIKVKPIEKANKVVDDATKSGANLVGGINYTFSDDLQKKLENDARVEAVKTAKERAQSLANAAGVRLGKVINVIENSSGYPIPMALKTNEAAGASDGSAPTNATPGENSVTTNVTIYYETY